MRNCNARLLSLWFYIDIAIMFIVLAQVIQFRHGSLELTVVPSVRFDIHLPAREVNYFIIRFFALIASHRSGNEDDSSSMDYQK